MQKLTDLIERISAEDLQKIVANICGAYSPQAMATILVAQTGDPTKRVAVVFYPFGIADDPSTILWGPTWNDALNSFIDLVDGAKT